VSCQLPDEDEPHEMLSCKFIVMPGMENHGNEPGVKCGLRAKMLRIRRFFVSFSALSFQ